MSGPSPVTSSAASGGVKSLFGGAKGIAIAVSAAVVVVAGVGAGIWKFAFPDPTLQVVERNVSYVFPAGAGTKTLIAGCLSNETLVSGGFSLPGGYVTLSDKSPSAQAWQVDGATTVGATTITAYALCINAKLDTYFLGYQPTQCYPYKITLSSGGVGHQSPDNRETFPGCPGGDLSTGVGFMLSSHVEGGTPPAPFRGAIPKSKANLWIWEMNPATSLAAILPPEAGTFAYIHTMCVKQLYNTVWLEKTFAASAKSTTTFTMSCPTDKLLVGGGYWFADSHDEFKNNNDFYDGWLYASHSAPPAAGIPSGKLAKAWYVTAVNNEVGGNKLLHDMIWWHNQLNPDGDVIGGSSYYGSVEFNPEDVPMYSLQSPDTRSLTMRILCSTSDATPTSPAKPIGVVPPMRPPIITPLATPIPTATATAGPSATMTPAAVPTLSVSPTQTTGFCANGQWDNKLTVKNTGGGTLSWHISSTLPTGVTASPGSGSLEHNTMKAVTLTGNASPPVQQFQVTFTSNGGAQTVTIICQ